MAYQVLLDVGGTGIKGRLENDEGKRWPVREFSSCAGEPQNVLIAHFCHICDTLRKEAKDEKQDIETIAMAFPGPFDYKKGIPLMKGLSKYETIYGCCLPDKMTEYWGSIRAVPRWFFINDVSAFALGVAAKHRRVNRAMCVCLGTGVGSAFLVNGKVASRAEEGIPENGWIYSLPCRGATIDDILSARGITQLTQCIAGKKLSPLELSIQARTGDSCAMAIWETYGHILCEALMPIADTFRAEALILGGKVARSNKLFDTELQRKCDTRKIQLIIESETTAAALSGLRIQMK